jgi:hypothetical protein
VLGVIEILRLRDLKTKQRRHWNFIKWGIISVSIEVHTISDKNVCYMIEGYLISMHKMIKNFKKNKKKSFGVSINYTNNGIIVEAQRVEFDNVHVQLFQSQISYITRRRWFQCM